MAFNLDAEAGDDDGAPISEINVTPMVDVMLVLLIIFMVAAPMLTVGVPVQLPRTEAQRVMPPQPPIVVSIDRDARVFLREAEVAEGALVERLVALRVAEGDAAPIHVRGDRAVPYGEVMRVMGRISAAGVGRVALIAEGATGATSSRAR